MPAVPVSHRSIIYNENKTATPEVLCCSLPDVVIASIIYDENKTATPEVLCCGLPDVVIALKY